MADNQYTCNNSLHLCMAYINNVYLYTMTKKSIDNKKKELGRILKNERESRRLKITEAATLIGTSHQNLSALETGKHFNFPTAVAVCSYYGLTIEIIKKAV